MQLMSWSKGLSVTSDGTGVVSHSGSVMLRLIADQVGLTGALSKALARPDFVPVHDRGLRQRFLERREVTRPAVLASFQVVRTDHWWESFCSFVEWLEPKLLLDEARYGERHVGSAVDS